MDLWKTDLEVLTTDDIEKYIQKHSGCLQRFEKLEDYYEGKNCKILDKRAPDPNNPDNRTPVPYGRKIITTFTGYAFRPKYITYKPQQKENVDPSVENANPYYDRLMEIFGKNQEHIKTARAGKNMGIYGVAYEIVYVDAEINTAQSGLAVTAEPRFFSVDPDEVILLYDFSSEPKKKIGIRYYEIDDTNYVVEVYYKDNIQVYKRTKDLNTSKWTYSVPTKYQNFFGEIPIVSYYFGDDCQGIFEPVIPLIDDYDLLISDSMNEFDRFASAYLILKKMSLVDPQLKKEASAWSTALKLLKKRRVFENVPDTGDIKFLTKDIPKEFIMFMTELIHDQIHVQSHVPDFMSAKMSTVVSGEAIKRMLFDFENVVSSAEADFDLGLYERIRLINKILEQVGGIKPEDPSSIVITHKRNLPFSLGDSADAALKMKQAGFSSKTILENMPDDMIPNVDEELERQQEELLGAMPDITNTQDPNSMSPTDAAVTNLQLNGAQLTSMVDMVKSVSSKEIPFDTAVDLILIALPGISRDVVEKMLRPAVSFQALVPQGLTPAKAPNGTTL